MGGVVGECFGGMDSCLRRNDGVRWVGLMGERGGRGDVECRGELRDLHRPSPDSSLPFGMTWG